MAIRYAVAGKKEQVSTYNKYRNRGLNDLSSVFPNGDWQGEAVDLYYFWVDATDRITPESYKDFKDAIQRQTDILMQLSYDAGTKGSTMPAPSEIEIVAVECEIPADEIKASSGWYKITSVQYNTVEA